MAMLDWNGRNGVMESGVGMYSEGIMNEPDPNPGEMELPLTEGCLLLLKNKAKQ